MNIFFRLNRLRQIRQAFGQGKTLLSYLPSRAWIELTDYCNLRCPLCPNQALPKEAKGFIAWDLYKKIIDQLSGEVFDLNLFHRGEPLLHPKVIEMIEYGRQKDISCRIHTNATLLSESLSQRLLDSGLDMLSFSFDGAQPPDYEKNRFPARFEETLEKIKTFLALKKERGQPRPVTILQMIRTNPADPDQQLKKFLASLRTLGLNRVVFRRPHNWGGAIGLPAGSPLSPEPLSACTFPWYALVVYWNGRVGPCPQDFFSRIILGDLNKQSVREVWNGPVMEKLRADLADRQYGLLKPCDQCDRPRRQTFSGVPLEYIKTFLKENLLGYH
jgi:radical SAM protein with 4Fe4S-binding SPASM domain